MKNSGRVARSSVYGSITVISNIVLNLILIFWLPGLPAYGIRGAAIATVLSRTLELILRLIENHKKDEVQFHFFNLFHREKSLTKDFFRYMSPVFFNYIVWAAA